MSRPRRSLVLLLAAVAVPALIPTAPGQDQPIPWGHGTHALRVILKDLRFQPQTPEQCRDQPENSLIIALGETWPLDRFPGGIRAFVEKGGALLIATDRERPITRLLTPGCWEQDFSVMVREPTVRVTGDNLGNRYRGSPECPIVWPHDNDSPILRSARFGVATNRPGCLATWRSANGAMLSAMARFPIGCAPANRELDHLIEPPLFAAGGEWGKGRLLVLADHSVFINDMMLQQDNDNITFAYNCLAWLRAGDKSRNRVLLYEEGNINDNFNVPLSPPPVPPPGPWMNYLLQEMENENLFNEALLGQVSIGQVLRAVLVALTVGLLLFGLWRLIKARHRVETASLPLATAVHRLAPPRPVLQQRHQEMMRRDNLWEAARTLARECFEPLTGAVDLPPMKVRGGWWERRQLKKQVHRLWHIAFGEAPVRVSVPEFTRLVQEIAQVKAARARGRIQLGPMARSP